MIPMQFIADALPRGEPPDVPLDGRIAEAIGDNGVLRALAQWCEAIRREVAHRVQESESRAAIFRRHHGPAGIGLIDVPLDWREDFPSSNGIAVGVALYLPAGFEDGGSPELRSFRLEIGGTLGQSVPVVLLPAHFTQNCHPAGGRASAVVHDGAERYLLTARHVVEKKPIGASVSLTCANCPGPGGRCTGTVAMKGHLYLDVALVKVLHCPCAASSPVSTSAGAQGITVRHHFASTGSAVQATVMQGIGTPASFVNAAAPLTFLTDVSGRPGDSGSAVTTDAFGRRAPTRDLVGSYSGKVDVLLPGGVVRTHGFAHDAEESMKLFGTTLGEGLYQ
jgi:hypothetical protein